MSKLKFTIRLLSYLFITSFVLCQQISYAEELEYLNQFTASGSGNRSGFSSPAVGELDGDTSNGKEIVAASINGVISAFNSSGNLLWEAFTPAAGCKAGRSNIHSTPAIGNLYGDGKAYVVIGYGNISKRCAGGILVFDGLNGTLKWSFSTTAFAKKEKFFAFLHTVFSSPAVADADGDGKLEIAFGSFDRSVYLLNHDGTVRWYYQAADTVWSSPIFANIDNTPDLELIAATDISQNLRIKPNTFNGGNLYAFRTKPNPKKVYRFRNKEAFLWMRPMEQVLFSSPRIAEIIPGNSNLEIAINSGCYFPDKSTQKVGRWTRIVNASNGIILRTLPIDACSSSTPALQDVNGDGFADIFVTVNGARQVGGDGISKIKAFDGATGNLLWSIEPRFNSRNYAFGGNFISPKVVSINNDGNYQVISPVHAGIGIFNALTGEQISSCGDLTCSISASLKTADIILNTPVIDDINYDGKKEIIVSGKSSRGTLGVYVWSLN
jgi:outer membrane protein assembly factor BamB